MASDVQTAAVPAAPPVMAARSLHEGDGDGAAVEYRLGAFLCRPGLAHDVLQRVFEMSDRDADRAVGGWTGNQEWDGAFLLVNHIESAHEAICRGQLLTIGRRDRIGGHALRFNVAVAQGTSRALEGGLVCGRTSECHPQCLRTFQSGICGEQRQNVIPTGVNQSAIKRLDNGSCAEQGEVAQRFAELQMIARRNRPPSFNKSGEFRPDSKTSSRSQGF